MQFGRPTSTAALVLLFATIVPAYAQRDRQDERQGRSENNQVRQQNQQQRGAPPVVQQQRTQRQQQQPQQQRVQQRNSSRDNAPNRPDRSVAGSRQPRGNSSVGGYGRAAGRAILPGGRVARNGGRASIAVGRSVAAMAVTTFLRTASVSISGVNTISGSTAAPRCTWGIRASPTAAFRSCFWIPGQNTGWKIGTPPMTSMSIMTTGTTSTTAGIRAPDWQSPSYCRWRWEDEHDLSGAGLSASRPT